MLSPIRNIVLPTDFSDCAAAATARAIGLARLDGATVHLVHALGVPLIAAPYEVSVPGAVWEGLRRGAEERLEEARKAVEAEGVASVTATVADGAEAARAIREVAEERDADIIVMGTHGFSGIKHAVLGSVAERTIRTVHRPVLAVKGAAADASKPWKRILLAVDFSEHSDAAFEAAAQLAARFGATLDLVHGLELPQAFVPYAWSAAFSIDLEERIQESANERMARLQERLGERGISAEMHLRGGRPSDLVPEMAVELESDLIVMGTRGHTGLQHLLLGSVAERTLRHAPCSVLVVTGGRPE